MRTCECITYLQNEAGLRWDPSHAISRGSRRKQLALGMGCSDEKTKAQGYSHRLECLPWLESLVILFKMPHCVVVQL